MSQYQRQDENLLSNQEIEDGKKTGADHCREKTMKYLMPIITIGLFVLLCFQFYFISQVPVEQTLFDYVEVAEVTCAVAT